MAAGWGGRERVKEYLVSSREETLGWVAGDYEDGKVRRRDDSEESAGGDCMAQGDDNRANVGRSILLAREGTQQASSVPIRSGRSGPCDMRTDNGRLREPTIWIR
jgi:hypothetical protein